MKLPDIAHGKEHTGVTNLAPDIGEHIELARRIEEYLQNVFISGVQPAQKTREFKDYRSRQPGGVAHVSAAYSDEKDGRYTAEVYASHRPSGLKVNYRLLADREHWMRSSARLQQQPREMILGPDAMLGDMIEYAPEDGETAKLLDGVMSARGLVRALFNDMNRSAHYRAGSDHYSTVDRQITSDGYVSARQIELIDARSNNKINRQLSVTALTNLGPGPVDISQRLVYDIELTNKGIVKSDNIQLIHTSSDGLTPNALKNLAGSSDVVNRRIDILHRALDDLSRDTL